MKGNFVKCLSVIVIQFVVIFSTFASYIHAELRENYIENACLENNSEGKKILIIYASRYGSTRTVATTVRDVLCSNGLQVDLSSAGKITDVSKYDAVILGSAINRLRILPEATEFLKQHREDLSNKILRFFILCSALREDTESVRAFALENFLEPSLEEFTEFEIIDSGLFGGVVDYRGMNFIEVFVMSVILKQTEGDFRNIDRIRQWAELISYTIKKE